MPSTEDVLTVGAIAFVIVWAVGGLLIDRGQERARRRHPNASRFIPPICASCGYDLRGLPPGTDCSECGKPSFARPMPHMLLLARDGRIPPGARRNARIMLTAAIGWPPAAALALYMISQPERWYILLGLVMLLIVGFAAPAIASDRLLLRLLCTRHGHLAREPRRRMRWTIVWGIFAASAGILATADHVRLGAGIVETITIVLHAAFILALSQLLHMFIRSAGDFARVVQGKGMESLASDIEGVSGVTRWLAPALWILCIPAGAVLLALPVVYVWIALPILLLRIDRRTADWMTDVGSTTTHEGDTARARVGQRRTDEPRATETTSCP